MRLQLFPMFLKRWDFFREKLNKGVAGKPDRLPAPKGYDYAK